MALDLQPLSLARVALGADERFSGAPVAELVRRHTAVQQLERMPIAMACVAARKRDGQVLAFTAGDVGLAVQASAAIEGQFAPVRIRGEDYVDADWHQPLPVRLARALGARVVVAVDATAHIDRAPAGAERYRAGDVKKKALVDADAEARGLRAQARLRLLGQPVARLPRARDRGGVSRCDGEGARVACGAPR